MHDERSTGDRKVENGDREVMRTNEARQGEVGKGAPMRRVLLISTIVTAGAFLIIYLAFVS